MKPILIIILLIISINIFAFESVLIDFSDLRDTTVDFSQVAQIHGMTVNEAVALKIDLGIKNWIVYVNSSSWTTLSRKKTYLLAVNKSNAYPDMDVLAARVYFPERYANSYAIIKPPFTIPSYYEDLDNPDGSGSLFLNKGVVRNVGILRKVTVRFLGNNFRYTLSVRIQNHKGEEKDIFIGFMNFVGWKTISWVNGNLDDELRLRDLYKNARPYYPDEYPFIKFKCFIIQRSDPEVTGNFITMIKDVKIDYDEAFLEIGNTELNQEEIFGIYQEELLDRARKETQDIHKRLYLEWQENQLKHK